MEEISSPQVLKPLRELEYGIQQLLNGLISLWVPYQVFQLNPWLPLVIFSKLNILKKLFKGNNLILGGTFIESSSVPLFKNVASCSKTGGCSSLSPNYPGLDGAVNFILNSKNLILLFLSCININPIKDNAKLYLGGDFSSPTVPGSNIVELTNSSVNMVGSGCTSVQMVSYSGNKIEEIIFCFC